MLEDYEVWRFLKEKGYKFIHFGSYWNPTSRNKYADDNYNLPFSLGFSLTLYRITMLSPIDSAFNITGLGSKHRRQQERVLYKFSKLAEMPELEGPIFVFAHMLLPHSPFIFDSNDDFLPEEKSRKRSKAVNYIDQLIATNKKMKMFIDTLLAKSESPPIIVLQADEGPHPQRSWEDMRDFDWRQATDMELREKMGILNAYYLPDIDKKTLYSSITPVNSFRVIFNLYFDTHLELLPDKVYAFVDRNHIYDFFDVTARAKRN